MAIKIQNVSQAVNDSGLKALVHGPAGIGKTILSATPSLEGNSVLIINAEAGLLSLKKFIDDNPKADEYIKITTINSIADLGDVYEELSDGGATDDYDWVALDSISDIAEVLLSEEKQKSKDARAAYMTMQDDIGKIIRKYRDLENINVLMTCKQQRKTDDYTGITSYVPLLPGQNLYQQIPYWFDEVFALRVLKDDDGVEYRALQTQKDLLYDAKDRSGMLLKFEKPDLNYIYHKIHNRSE